jgi:hypothetical protein
MSFYKEVPGRQTTLESTLKFDTEPKAGSTNPVTSDGLKSAIDKSAENSLDDHDPDDLIIFDGSKDFYDEHELGYYYALGDKIYLCTEHTRSGEEGAYTYSTKLTKQNGVVPVLNQLVDLIVDANKMQVIAAALNDLDARLKAVEESISSVNIGSRVADELDAQSLKVGGEDINTVIQNAIGG